MTKKNTRVYTDAVVGDRVQVTKALSEMAGWSGVVVKHDKYTAQADWYGVELDDPDQLLGEDKLVWFRASEIEKA